MALALPQPVCEPLIDAEQAAQAIGLSARQVRRLAALEEIPAFKQRGVRGWRFRKSLLDEWARRQLESSCSQRSPKGSSK